jgi:hypothetical protein
VSVYIALNLSRNSLYLSFCIMTNFSCLGLASWMPSSNNGVDITWKPRIVTQTFLLFLVYKHPLSCCPQRLSNSHILVGAPFANSETQFYIPSGWMLTSWMITPLAYYLKVHVAIGQLSPTPPHRPWPISVLPRC